MAVGRCPDEVHLCGAEPSFHFTTRRWDGDTKTGLQSHLSQHKIEGRRSIISQTLISGLHMANTSGRYWECKTLPAVAELTEC